MERPRFVPAPPARDRVRWVMGVGACVVAGALVIGLGRTIAERRTEPARVTEPVEPAPSSTRLLERLGLRRAPVDPAPPGPAPEPVAAPIEADDLAPLREAASDLIEARTRACEQLVRARAADVDAIAIERLSREIGPCPDAPATPRESPDGVPVDDRAL